MYKQIIFFSQHYAHAGLEERRALEDFMTCETNESVVSLRNELTALIQTNPPEDILEKTLGPARKSRFGSYKEWAKMMLLWMNSYKG